MGRDFITTKYKLNKNKGLNFHVAMAPSGPKGLTGCRTQGGFVIPKTSTNKKLAVKFCLFLNTVKSYQLRPGRFFCQPAPQPKINKDLKNRFVENMGSEKSFNLVLESMTKQFPRPLIVRWVDFQQRMQKLDDNLIVTKSIDERTYLNELQKAMEEVLQKEIE
jgi:hypothetical protein